MYLLSLDHELTLNLIQVPEPQVSGILLRGYTFSPHFGVWLGWLIRMETVWLNPGCVRCIYTSKTEALLVTCHHRILSTRITSPEAQPIGIVQILVNSQNHELKQTISLYKAKLPWEFCSSGRKLPNILPFPFPLSNSELLSCRTLALSICNEYICCRPLHCSTPVMCCLHSQPPLSAVTILNVTAQNEFWVKFLTRRAGLL